MEQVPDTARRYFADGLIDGWNLRAVGITITEGKYVVGPIHAPVYSCRAEFTKDGPAALAGLHAASWRSIRCSATSRPTPRTAARVSSFT
jgi:hypothetical protein